MALIKLDLGSGPTPLEGYVGVDRAAPFGSERVVSHDFGSGLPWPFADGSASELHCSHLIEHLPQRLPGGKDALVYFFEEAWRVATPGALFRLRWPAPIDERFQGEGILPPFLPSALWDPTHYRIIPREQIEIYMSREGRRRLGVEFYDWRCNWVVTSPTFLRILNETAPILEYNVELRKESLS